MPTRAATSRLESVLDLAVRLTRASHGGLELLSREGDPAEPALAALARLVSTRLRSVRLADRRAAHELGLSTQLPFDGPLLAVPLLNHGQSQGMLYLVRQPGAAPFTACDVEAVLSLCLLIEQEPMAAGVDLVNQVRLLTRVAQAAAGNLDLGRIFDVALYELERYLPMNACAVWLAEEAEPGCTDVAPASLLTLARVGEGEGRTTRLGLHAGLQVPLDETPFGQCFKDGQAIYLDLRRQEPGSADHASPLLAQRLAAHGATFFFAVALRAGDRTVGVLQSICRRQTGFTGEQIQLLYRAADLLGPAISNCQIFTRLQAAYEQLRLTQQQLIQSEKMRAVGELASGMAHDFNNSLCGVLGFLELALLEQRLPGGSRGYLESARTCAQDAAETVRRVQEFARRDRHQSSSQPTDINDLVRQTVELTRPRWENATNARGRPVAVELQLEAKAAVMAVQAELREGLTNLIFNAVDAMPHGGTLTLSTWSAKADGSLDGEDAAPDLVYLAVRDTGVGMSEQVRRRLFEPFFTTKGEYGNGLGLSVTFGIVQRHGGEITVESAEGAGSTFTLRLPAGKQEVRASGQVPVVKVAEPAKGPGLRILVVDDEESIRGFLHTALVHLGHRPRVTGTATEALAAFGQERFDLVLTDLGLPDVSGEEVARQVTQKRPGTPVVLLTGWADQLRADKKCPTGVMQVLGKPITLEKLSQALQGVVDGR